MDGARAGDLGLRGRREHRPREGAPEPRRRTDDDRRAAHGTVVVGEELRRTDPTRHPPSRHPPILPADALTPFVTQARPVSGPRLLPSDRQRPGGRRPPPLRCVSRRSTASVAVRFSRAAPQSRARRSLGVGGRAHALSLPAAPVAVGDGLAIWPRDAWAPGPPVGPLAAEEVRFLLVHHTAASTQHRASDVPGILGAMYRFHTGEKGWPDIAYNFLVDREGGVWEGRAGSLAGPVAADATGGSQGFAQLVCFIGDFTGELPSAAALAAGTRTLAWLCSALRRLDGGRRDGELHLPRVESLAGWRRCHHRDDRGSPRHVDHRVSRQRVLPLRPQRTPTRRAGGARRLAVRACDCCSRDAPHAATTAPRDDRAHRRPHHPPRQPPRPRVRLRRHRRPPTNPRQRQPPTHRLLPLRRLQRRPICAPRTLLARPPLRRRPRPLVGTSSRPHPQGIRAAEAARSCRSSPRRPAPQPRSSGCVSAPIVPMPTRTPTGASRFRPLRTAPRDGGRVGDRSRGAGRRDGSSGRRRRTAPWRCGRRRVSPSPARSPHRQRVPR